MPKTHQMYFLAQHRQERQSAISCPIRTTISHHEEKMEMTGTCCEEAQRVILRWTPQGKGEKKRRPKRDLVTIPGKRSEREWPLVGDSEAQRL